jgi:hypothetical protein
MGTAIIRKVLFWIPLTFIGFLNGFFRGWVLTYFLSDFHARQISSLLMVIWVFLYTKFIFGKLEVRKVFDAWLTGIVWLLLTMTFEFGLGYFVLGLTMEVMVSDYNLLEGRFWSLVLMAILVIPALYFTVLREHDHEKAQVR